MTKEEILHWISNRSLHLSDLPEKFRKDKEIVLAAVESDKDALRHVDASLQNDPEILNATEKNKP